MTTKPDEHHDPRADALRARYQELFGGAPIPVPIEAIAEDLLGLRVEEVDELPVSGMLVPADRLISVNGREAAQSPGRRRFTLAHEVGHWVCQCLEGRGAPIMCRAEDVTAAPAPRALEREANIFAAELLMPEDAVREAWTDDAWALGVRFGVSAEAAAWRAYGFGLLADRPSRAAPV